MSRSNAIYELWKKALAATALGGVVLSTVATLGSAAVASTSIITPFIGRPPNWDCRPLTLDQGNAIGIATLPVDQQTVDARVFYREGGSSGGRSRNIELRMMKEDAQALQGEVTAIIRRVRPRPLRFEARVDKGGRCEFFQVTG